MKAAIARTAAAVALLAVWAGAAQADGDPEKGAKVFNKCKACHSVDAGKNKLGPSLHGVIGRTSGTVEGFKYSKAMQEAGVEWNEETLDAYLTNPREYIPGNKMVFVGLKKEEERADLIAYLKQASE